ncbi:MAG TPA: PilC/PilY family type IV pilus protein [Burkholderiales bacterium]|nr:PilC/PilY family type IV pilus protein [Burkholderiales bacterium]
MKHAARQYLRRLIATIAFGCLALPMLYATPAFAAAITLADTPLYIGGNVPPMVMLDISKDHLLYEKAFNDYSDLDGDGTVETTYKHGIDYYGYFDSYKCYTYDTTDNRFTPAEYHAKNLTEGPDGADNLAAKYCNQDGATGQWSGNFLNWISMSRMDEVRKLLYGGYRSTDGTGANGITVLERAFITTDAHSWAKYYNGSDIGKLTPFTTVLNSPQTYSYSTTHNNSKIELQQSGSQSFALSVSGSTYPISAGDQLLLDAGGGNTMTAGVSGVSGNTVTIVVQTATAASGVGWGTKFSDWTITNLNSTGISFCNTTDHNGSAYSQNITDPPLIKAARGDFALWSANERWQCHWSQQSSNQQSGFGGGFLSNGNRASYSGIDASAENPSQTTVGLGTGSNDVTTGSSQGTYYARVQVCDPGSDGTLLGQEHCKQYPDGDYKPIGLLQEYGDPNLIYFGLMTGTYDKNVSGGVLRKNVGSFNDEVNISSDGTFKTPSTGSIVSTLNDMRLYGYSYGDGTYIGGDSCNYQQIGIVSDGSGQNAQGKAANQGNCSTWGNPMSEIYAESLRYFAGKNADASFAQKSNGKDATLGLTVATWTDPLTEQNFCAPLNTLIFNASVNSYDGNQLSGFSTDISGGETAGQLTDEIGDAEGITGKSWFIGNTGASQTSDCSPKTVDDLGTANGICPEAPTQEGTYDIAGEAWYAHTNRIRTDISLPSGAPKNSLKVDTYGVQLATNTPKIPIPDPSDTSKTIATIVPQYRLDWNPNYGSGTIVDFKLVSQDAAKGTGSFYVNWEDSNFGGDYDQDVWGIISYCVQKGSTSCPAVNGTTPPDGTITVTTDVVSASTANPQGFGYAISGTTQDGVHFHSGIYNFNYPHTQTAKQTPSAPNNGLGSVELDGSGVLGCTTCNVEDNPTSWIYTLGNATAGTLQDPLYYAAKWGGFTDENGNGKPDQQTEWDQKKQNGTAGEDGIPDNFFYVTNPNALEVALEKAFIFILQNSSASSVATNSTSLNTGTKLYQARFNPNDWSGQLLEYSVNAVTGEPNVTPDWDAGQKLNAIDPNDRVILTYNNDSSSRQGVAFRWPTSTPPGATDLSAAEVLDLETAPSGTVESEARGKLRLNYLRGDPTNEGVTATSFRQRLISKLGDIVNSNPFFVGAPSRGIPDASHITFYENYLDRDAMIYVGANDGMLHGFDVTQGGKEVLAFIPSAVFPNLSRLTAPDYAHHYYVDGSPVVRDAKMSDGTWKTVLVGGLNHGGQGIYALDVTDPSQFKESNASDIVMWEFNDTDDADLGYTYGTPTIAEMANGKWAAIVSGGYNNSEADGHASTTGHAVLFIIFLDGPSGPNNTWVPGTDYIKIDTGSGSTAAPDGLAAPFAADINADGKVDFVYAGDLTGQMWKFDVRSTTAADWKLAANRVVLFSATDSTSNPQPITAQAKVTLGPTGQGLMVAFGTGQYLQASDVNPPFKTQSFYGIWDKNDSDTTVSAQTAVTARTELQQQTITDTTTSNGTTFRTISNTMPDWTTKLGWYMDFPNTDPYTGERVIYPPIIVGGRLIYTTVIPSAAACLSGGTSFLYVIDPTTGGQIPGPVLDFNGDGNLNGDDLVTDTTDYASAVQSTSGLMPTPTLIRVPGQNKAIGEISTSSGQLETVPLGLAGKSPRISWRELIGK